jgi:putative transposase
LTHCRKRSQACALQRHLQASRFISSSRDSGSFGVRRLDAAFVLSHFDVMKDWPHAPVHKLSEQGAYMVTCGTYRKAHHLCSANRLTFFRNLLFETARETGWELQAWAILSNHYHFVASSPDNPRILRTFLSKLHTISAIKLNDWDRTPGRKVWFQYWDTHITFPASYFPRLRYVHQNPAHHGIIARAENYRGCSAAWFERTACTAFLDTVNSFKTDRLHVRDNFEPKAVTGSCQSGVKPPHSKGISPAL